MHPRPLLKVSPPHPIAGRLTGAGNREPHVSAPRGLPAGRGGERVLGRGSGSMTRNRTHPLFQVFRKLLLLSPQIEAEPILTWPNSFIKPQTNRYVTQRLCAARLRSCARRPTAPLPKLSGAAVLQANCIFLGLKWVQLPHSLSPHHGRLLRVHLFPKVWLFSPVASKACNADCSSLLLQRESSRPWKSSVVKCPFIFEA